MRYTYDVCTRTVPSSDSSRLSTTTNPAEVKCDFGTQFVRVWDNSSSMCGDSFAVLTITQWEQWCQNEDIKSSMRAEAKSDKVTTAYPDISMMLADKNVKTAAAAGKPRVSDIPPVAVFAMGEAMSWGARNRPDPYGRFNWRDTEVTASVFYDAMRRHLDDWYAGQDFADDSKVHHLAHMMAGGGIVLDAIAIGKFNDDRDPRGPLATDSSVWKNTK